MELFSLCMLASLPAAEAHIFIGHTACHQLPNTFMQISALCRRSCTKDSAASNAMPSGSSFTEALRLASVLEMGTLGSKGRPKATCRTQSIYASHRKMHQGDS